MYVRVDFGSYGFAGATSQAETEAFESGLIAELAALKPKPIYLSPQAAGYYTLSYAINSFGARWNFHNIIE